MEKSCRYTYVYGFAHTHTHTHTCIYTSYSLPTHTYIDTYVCIQIYMYICIQASAQTVHSCGRLVSPLSHDIFPRTGGTPGAHTEPRLLHCLPVPASTQDTDVVPSLFFISRWLPRISEVCPQPLPSTATAASFFPCSFYLHWLPPGVSIQKQVQVSVSRSCPATQG